MGIPRFIGILREQGYASIFYQGVPDEPASLLIDGNGILHEVAQQTFGYGKPEYQKPEVWARISAMSSDERMRAYLDNVGTKLINVITAVGPIEYLVIAIDGPAPIGKVSQQRRRRYKAALPQIPLDPNAPVPPKFFESNSITPGTQFMIELDEYLQNWIVENRYMLPVTVYYSSHREPGEGEHKIMRLIREGKIQGLDKYHVVYGLDADLLMLSMLSPLPKMILMREDVNDVIHVDEFRRLLKLQFPEKQARVVNDYVLMMMLLGNDFLPKVDAMKEMKEAMDTILEVYAGWSGTLTNADGTIIWQAMQEFIAALAKLETLFYSFQLKRNYTSPLLRFATREVMGREYEKTFLPDKYREAYYYNEFRPLGPEADVYALQKLEGKDIFTTSEAKIQAMITAYLTTWAWTYDYYRLGQSSINPEWFYSYNHAPLLQDTANFLKGNLNLGQWKSAPGQEGFGIFEQMLAVLPRRSAHLLPMPIRVLMNDLSPIADMFPVNFVMERYDIINEEQAIAILPPVEPGRLRAVVGEYRKLYERENGPLNKYSPAEVMGFAINKEEQDDYRKKIQDANRLLVRQAFRQASRGYSVQGTRSPRQVGEGQRGGFRGRGQEQRGGYQGQRGGERGGYRGQQRGEMAVFVEEVNNAAAIAGGENNVVATNAAVTNAAAIKKDRDNKS